MSANEDWEFEVRSKKSPRYAMIAAAVLVVVHVTLGVLLRTSATGVYFRVVDQFAMAGIGILLAGGVLLLTRPRLRVGPRGIAVRNILGERIVDWDLDEGMSFPDGAPWARIELPDDEYVPVMAIQANDGEHAVRAVRRFRELEAKYTGSRAA
ncbi:PH domain-containing protein [Rhodococcus sp. TAF43]|uniref:PH domain-containing protein n=1 Tax=unclassified Rhodococcus (in: high G+C Gram-positive bacteria) TaxID=192944 RepID=UPI000E0BF928|nr:MULTISPECIES: PH domain-containing protein [unclassified Rhodococcus (in: high G+C Gram-positive bacteria)]QKT11431.1 PH domain-containing protein [Rhodococcus sp. W8901]RDI21832.1 PH (Pleckstrin Homology) domain-containing protein [Rhodococcus sp. AG1013]